jgi:hypothetical protein
MVFSGRLKILLFLLLATIDFFSQNDTIKKRHSTEFGIYHSMNFTTFNGSVTEVNTRLTSDRVVVTNPRFTFDFGLFAGFELTKRLVLQTELAYTYMGAHTKRETTLYHDLGKVKGNTTESYSLRYMKLPVSLQYYFRDNYFMSAGGYASLLIGSSKFYPWDWDRGSETLENVENYDAGLLFGVGVDLTYLVKINFRYHLGLVDVFTSEDVSFKNSVYQVSFNWKIIKD